MAPNKIVNDSHRTKSWFERPKISRPIKQCIYRIIEVICWISILGYAIFCTYLLAWGRALHWRDPRYVADYDVLGNFGDFLAGSLGSLIGIVSVYLLIRTLKWQRKATEQNIVQMEIQRFNDLFFRLLDLYRELADSLCVEPSGDHGRTPNTPHEGINYFVYRRDEIIDSVTATSVKEAREEALKKYRELYNADSDKLGAYFRTLYRLLELTDVSDIPELEKRRYAKIIRAQLSEAELFIIYYNSLTPRGVKLGNYIWKYHILKHLDISEITEFKKYKQILNDAELIEINSIYSQIYPVVRTFVDIGKSKPVTYKFGNYEYSLNFSKSDTSNKKIVNIKVRLTKLYDKRSYPNFADWGRKKLKELFTDILIVMGTYSAFSGYQCTCELITPGLKTISFVFRFSHLSANT